ncbi:unnamed protein product [Phaeothamnion confervicola]
MPRILIQSSKFRSVGYSPGDQILELEFGDVRQRGIVWQFYGVPSNVPLEFMMAASKGKFYQSHIYGRWESRQVTPEQQIFSDP